MAKKIRRKVYQWASQVWPYLILALIAIVMLWCQFSQRTFIVSLRGDSVFHINQFYESAMQIKTGHFSWFLNLFSFGQAGRVVNAVYGPMFSYLMGGLLLLAGTWLKFQLILEFLVFVLGGAFMYMLSRSVHLGQVLSLVLGTIYMTVYPITMFVNSKMFDGIGNVLMPLVIMAGIKIWSTHRVRWVPLATLIAVTFQIHVLTTAEALLVLLPFIAIALWLSTDRGRFIGQLVKAALLCLALTFNIWGSILDIFYKNHIIKPFPNGNMANVSSSLGWFNKSFVPLHVFFVMIMLMILGLILLNFRELTMDRLMIPLLAVLYLFLSSKYFPWRLLAHFYPPISQVIQLPDRFLGIAVILILLTAGMNVHYLSCSYDKVRRAIAVVAVLALACGAVDSVRIERTNIEDRVYNWGSKWMHVPQDSAVYLRTDLHRIDRALSHSRNLGLAPDYIIKSSPDYLPSNQFTTIHNYHRIHPYQAVLEDLYGYRSIQHRFRDPRRDYYQFAKLPSPLHHLRKVVSRRSLIIKWRQPKRYAGRRTVLPVAKYHHTVVHLDGARYRAKHLRINRIGLIQLHPGAGSHQIRIHYQALPYWKVGIDVAALSWLWALVYFCFPKRWRDAVNGHDRD